LIALGDIVDFWQISNYRAPEERQLNPDQIEIQESLDETEKHLGIMITESGATDLKYLGGNHEDRWDRLLSSVRSDPKTRALFQIPKIKQTLSLEYLLGLEELGFDYYPYYEKEATLILNDRIVMVHGWKSNKWIGSSMLERFGKSVMFGHDHRIQNFVRRDLHGTNSAWGIGCLCTLSPHWMRFPNWHQGFAVITWKDTNRGMFFQVDQVRIHDGKSVFRGKLYRG
jgi:hypothetical protein